MKNFFLVCLMLIQFSCYTAKINKSGEDYKCRIEKTEDGDCEEGIIANVTTRFPETSPAGDYNVKGYQIKMAFPIDAETARIWVKGNENLRYVQVFSRQSQALSKTLFLEPPFFTAMIAIPASHKEATVKFAVTPSGLPDAPRKLMAYPKSKKDMEKKEDQFSFLFYGCFQPFRVNPDTKLGEVLHEKDTLNYITRRLFMEVGNQKEFQYQSYQQDSMTADKLLSNPKLVIGGGDQVYTDAGYEDKDFKDHPLSAWAHNCSDPYPVLDTLEYARHLDRCYFHFNSFDCFESMFSKMPSISTWDDHETRDGWGSHGDEYNADGTMNETLKPYYFSSRKAFIDHQYIIGPHAVDAQTLSSNQSLEQITRVNGLDIFIFDLRSNRNNCKKQTVETAQLQTFKDWCAGLESGKEAIVVSSIPFFYSTSGVVSALAEGIYEGPLRDDIIDGWASAANIGQRDTIINELIKLRSRNIKPIILSSDVHIGGLITTWYENPVSGKNEKLCYEIISSGLSHESLGEARSGIVASLRKRSRKVEKDESAFTVNGKAIYPVFNFTRSRLNFAALEFTKNKNTVASLFIVGDDDGTVTEREMPLDWNESFRTFYKRGYKPLHWFLLPWKLFDRKMPEVAFNLIKIKDMQGE